MPCVLLIVIREYNSNNFILKVFFAFFKKLHTSFSRKKTMTSDLSRPHIICSFVNQIFLVSIISYLGTDHYLAGGEGGGK